jgi:predicted transcriptional regulator of viral defense system
MLQKLKKLLKAPHFTSQEAIELGVSSALLSYYVKIGALERLGRGIYRGINAKTVNDFKIEDLANSIACAKNGVICLISALAFYELTDETPRQHWIAVPHKTRHRASPSVKIIRYRNIDLGKTYIKDNGISLPIFDRERTILDSFRYLGIETSLKALSLALSKKGKEKINIEKLRKYSNILHININSYILALTT